MGDNLDFSILQVKTNSDKVYRDTLCMAYVCSILDLPMSDFYTGVKSTVKKDSDIEGLIEMLQIDIEIRVKRLLGV
jgi:hypothetical protein